MGKYFIDQYSLLHFAVGILLKKIGFNFETVLVGHIIFEIAENSNKGIYIINKYLKIWPGGKPSPDTVINQIGDIVSCLIGFKFMEISNDNIILLSSIGIIIYFWLYPIFKELILCVLLSVSLFDEQFIYIFIACAMTLLLDRLGESYGLTPHYISKVSIL